ncbi:MAG: hypothetical protein ACXVNM_12155 [Bacteroidia bacterium]
MPDHPESSQNQHDSTGSTPLNKVLKALQILHALLPERTQHKQSDKAHHPFKAELLFGYIPGCCIIYTPKLIFHNVYQAFHLISTREFTRQIANRYIFNHLHTAVTHPEF